jgi:RNA polymerase sigma factor (sigma-70 family)
LPSEEDLVQAAVKMCFLKLHLFRGESLLAWASVVSNNLFRSIARLCDRVLTPGEDVIDEITDPRATPHDELERREEVSRLYTLVHQLRPRTRDVICLVLTDLPNADIAQRLGISERTVRKHIQKGVEQLRLGFGAGA